MDATPATLADGMDDRDRARYWKKVKKGGPDECWLWTGFLSLGYGAFTYYTDRKPTKAGAHRLSYEIAHGPILPGNVVRHSCDNPACVNPAHLAQGSVDENVSDRVARNRSATGVRNGRSKLTPETVRLMRHVSAMGLSAHKMSQVMQLDYQTVRRAIKGENWAEIGA